MASGIALKLRVEGMDCGACATKIETAMRRLPGVSHVDVSFNRESLSLVLDEDRTSRTVVEKRIAAMGYRPVDPAMAAGGREALPGEAGRTDRAATWWSSPKGQLAVVTGGLLVVAFLISHVEPGWAAWPYIGATVIGLVPIARRALAGARSGMPFGIETLMSIAAIGAIAIGEAEEAAVVVFLFTVGELLEGIAASRARSGIQALIDLVPRTALRLRDGEIASVAANELAVGDVVVVRAGDRIPSDGTVCAGESEVDEAPVTGESVPVAKQTGSSVYAGSINANGELHIRITRTAADNTIARIVHLVEEAQASKAPMARFIDRFSRWYTPAAMAIAAAVVLVPPLAFGGDWDTWIYRGLAVLLVACPCALVISTPAAIASGLAAGARRGLLVKGGAALETAGKVRTIAFDKTGTLTVGRPRVTDVVAFDGDEGDLLAKAAAVEERTSHPLGLAIVEEARGRGVTLPKVYGGALVTPGKAVTARLKAGFISVGSPRHAREQDVLAGAADERVAALESAGKTVVVVSEGKRTLGVIALRDEPRDDAAQALNRLRGLGLRTVMLTGDNARTAAAIAAPLGIEVQAELLPDAKLRALAAYRAEGPIAMVGDGINDAPALAAASVGVAMGAGTDVALETADAALLRNRISDVVEFVALSRATLANIWQNISLAVGLKGLFLATTVVGATPLWVAILADTGATVLVTANALRLLRRRA
ncbi:MAG: heavy metal translocating P-type ATPase [Pseudomonadota bacterium]